jgi:hypothetical protein
MGYVIMPPIRSKRGGTIMPIGVDDVLIAAAEAAGAQFGQTLATRFADALFNNLVTINQLRAAIAALEAFMKQELDELRTDLLINAVNSAIGKLQSHTPEHHLKGDSPNLEDADNFLVSAHSWISQQTATDQDGEDYLHLHYVQIVQFVTINVAVWLQYATENSQKTSTLLTRIDESVDLLTRAVNRIRTMETETVSSITLVHNRVGGQGGRGPDPVDGDVSYDVRDSYRLTRGIYPGGVKEVVVSDIVPEPGEIDSLDNQIRSQLAADTKRIQDENDKRQRTIYGPAAQFLSAMAALKNKFQERAA